MNSTKYIGIDYGTKKTGIAVSDASGSLAFPREVLVTDRSLVGTIADLMKDEEITNVVIGESRDLQGGLNKVDGNAKSFIENLKTSAEQDLQVFYEDERFTTKQARALPFEGWARGNIANAKIGKVATKQADAQAAAIILQSFLDKQKNSS